MEGAKDQFFDRFVELTQLDISGQVEFFLKSFIFALGDDWTQVTVLAQRFSDYLLEKAERHELDASQAADFLQRMGRTRTAMERRAEIKDVDLDNNDRICFIEYLLLHYKVMILQEYFKRHDREPSIALDNDGVGLINVGPMLLEELFTFPMGMDPEIERAIEQFTSAQRTRSNLIRDLNAKVLLGGVKGMTAKNELFQLEGEDKTSTNRLELTLNAAKRRSAKHSGPAALAKKKQDEEEAKAAKLAASRAKLAARAAAFEGK